MCYQNILSENSTYCNGDKHCNNYTTIVVQSSDWPLNPQSTYCNGDKHCNNYPTNVVQSSDWPLNPQSTYCNGDEHCGWLDNNGGVIITVLVSITVSRLWVQGSVGWLDNIGGVIITVLVSITVSRLWVTIYLLKQVHWSLVSSDWPSNPQSTYWFEGQSDETRDQWTVASVS
jgi:hypothetical protein